MNLYPAIDLLGGNVVRLRQGDYDDSTVYGDDPVSVARAFVDAGSAWVHLVDLDGARTGSPANRGVIADVCAAIAGRARVQVGGGVRTIADVESLVGTGVARVVMGSAAVADPSLVARAATVMPVAVGLDHRGGEAAVHGWTQGSGRSVADLVGEFPDAAAFVVTDISRDGMLTGPDTDGLASLAAATSIPIIASGGVGALADLRALAAVGTLEGVIVGKAIYEGRFTVSDALEVLR